MAIRFEPDQIVIEPFLKLFFGKKIKIPYENIERIEFPPGENVLFYMKNKKEIKVADPGIVMFYSGFGEMLKNYNIPYINLLEGSENASIGTVRTKSTSTRDTVVSQLNRLLEEKLGPEYEIDAKLVERIISTTLEIRLIKNGSILEAANTDESIDGEPLLDEMDLAFLSEWDPIYEEGKYGFTEEVNNSASCEKYVEEVILDKILDAIEK